MEISEKETPQENKYCNYNDLIKSKGTVEFLVKHFYSIELENKPDNT